MGSAAQAQLLRAHARQRPAEPARRRGPAAGSRCPAALRTAAAQALLEPARAPPASCPWPAAASSAAAVGVGARTSAQKSAIVKSVSWPTPLISGTGLCTMVRASCSSLKAHRSSIEPPPRTSRITSTLPASARRYSACSARTSSAGACAPCTAAGASTTGTCGSAPPQRGHDVVQRRGAERGHHADAARQHRQRPLAGRVEQALRFQPGLELQELLEQGALAGPAQAFDDQLQVAARLVDGQPAQHFDLFAVARHEIQQARPRGGTWRSAIWPCGVLQREVAMSAGCAREARNLAAHRDRIEAGFQSISNSAA